MDKVSYALGIGIGHQLANMGGSALNIDDFAQAVKDVLAGGELKIKSSEAQQIVQEFFAAQEEKISKQRAEAGKAHKEAGEKYLAENAKKDGVITLPSGLQYQVLKEGNGKKPSAKDSVKCHYEGFPSTVPYLTAASSAASPPSSDYSRSSPVGRKVCS